MCIERFKRVPLHNGGSIPCSADTGRQAISVLEFEIDVAARNVFHGLLVLVVEVIVL